MSTELKWKPSDKPQNSREYYHSKISLEQMKKDEKPNQYEISQLEARILKYDTQNKKNRID